MAEITAKLVNELRAKTGQGMMECKRMLTETNGDLQAAIDAFRKKGVKASLTERAATEGQVVGVVAEDRKSAALVEINCNTDFTARTPDILALGAKIAKQLLHNPSVDISTVATSDITETSQKTGENVRVGKTAIVSNPTGRVGLYVYSISGKIGVLISLSGNVVNVTDELITDLGGHIAFSNPMSLNRQGLPAEVVAKEREIAVEQAKATGKPQEIAEKIAEGKLNAFFKEQALLDQDFFNPGKFKGSITALLQQKGLTLDKFVRIEVGK